MQEVRQRKTNTIRLQSYAKNLKNKRINKQTNKQKQNQSYEHREQTEGSQRGRGGGLGKVGGREWEVQASSGGMSKSWGCQAPHEECGH